MDLILTLEIFGRYSSHWREVCADCLANSGRGLFLSIEFVTNRATKGTFPANIPISLLLDDAMFGRGVSIYSGFGKGTADGIVGDHILFSPPLTVSKEEIDVIIKATKEAIDEIFRLPNVVAAMQG